MVPGGGYLLAIWFNKIPERTVVWSANRDDLDDEGSKIQLLADGRFELDDPRGQQIWSADVGSSSVAYGAMLDTGDFVLAGNSSVVLWQSFDHPTDTILPAQIFNQRGNLVCSFSEMNYSSGRFMFAMQDDGNLVFYTRNFPVGNDIDVYWASNTVGIGFRVIFNQSGYIFLTAKNGTILNYFLSPNGASTGQYYQRVILHYDGVLRHYLYPKSGNSTGGRPLAWSVLDFLPGNICLERQTLGWNVCGFNSICFLGIDQKPKCLPNRLLSCQSK